jgi:hypothetical protein
MGNETESSLYSIKSEDLALLHERVTALKTPLDIPNLIKKITNENLFDSNLDGKRPYGKPTSAELLGRVIWVPGANK